MPFHWFESIQIGNDINYYTVFSRTQPSFHFRTLLLNDLKFALSVYFIQQESYFWKISRNNLFQTNSAAESSVINSQPANNCIYCGLCKENSLVRMGLIAPELASKKGTWSSYSTWNCQCKWWHYTLHCLHF